MENLSTLNILKELIEEHKTESLKLLIGESSRRYTTLHCDIILNMIEGLKDAEKEQSRLDWKTGYIHCCLDCAEFFGNDRNEAYPTDSEMEEIDQQSFEFMKRKK